MSEQKNHGEMTLEEIEKKIAEYQKLINTLHCDTIEEFKMKMKEYQKTLTNFQNFYNMIVTKKSMKNSKGRLFNRPEQEPTKEELMKLINS